MSVGRHDLGKPAHTGTGVSIGDWQQGWIRMNFIEVLDDRRGLKQDHPGSVDDKCGQQSLRIDGPITFAQMLFAEKIDRYEFCIDPLQIEGHTQAISRKGSPMSI